MGLSAADAFLIDGVALRRFTLEQLRNYIIDKHIFEHSMHRRMERVEAKIADAARRADAIGMDLSKE